MSRLPEIGANLARVSEPSATESVPPSTEPVMSMLGVPRRLSVEADSVVVELTVVPGVTVTKSGMVV